MAVKTYWAKPEEKQEIVEFIDYVFSKAHRPHDFATLLPKLYGENGDGAAHHFVVREDGRIAATVLAYPVIAHMGDKRIVTLGVGSVSTHPAARGKGYMKTIMDAVDARAKEMGAAYSTLSGLRQRYEHFGYTAFGYQMNATLSAHNVEHALRDTDTAGYAVAPMTQEHVPAAIAMQQKQIGYCERSEEKYLDIMRSWYNEPFVLLKDGCAVGFGARRQNPGSCHIAELLTENEDDFRAAVKLLSAQHGELTTTVAPWQKARAAWVASVAQPFAIAPKHGYKIYDEAAVRSACAEMGEGNAKVSFDGFILPLPLYTSPLDAV